MIALATADLTKRYGKTQALAGINLAIPDGSIYGLVGPNGSGKTTALEILAGLRHPTSGTVDLNVEGADVAYCPDVGDFEPWLTAAEVLDSASGLLGRPRTRGRIDEMLERVGIADAANRQVGGFSRGMRSRLGLAAGLIGDPKLLIADEPAAALDPAGRREIIDLLEGLAGSMTVLVSSHDLADVERICDQIGILVKGRIVYQGGLGELLDRAAPALQVVVRPPADRLMAMLTAAPWARSVAESDPGVVRIDLADPVAAERELPQVLAKSESRLVEVGRAGVSLQDIFFELTGTGPRRSHPERERRQ
jgi:ABC-2 type transport system ATP-binding protein